MKKRFEDQVDILLACCDRPMRCAGNLSLREAGKAGLGFTMLGYECGTCFRRVAVVDEWPSPSRRTLSEMDAVE